MNDVRIKIGVCGAVALAARWMLARLMIVCLLVGISAEELLAQAIERLMDQEPFDRIRLKEAFGGTIVDIVPLDWDERVMPEEPNPRDEIVFRDLTEPGQKRVEWRAVEEIEFFEDMVLQEANAFTSRTALANKDFAKILKQFDAAFDYYFFLKRNYPKTRRLDLSIQVYLYRNAAILVKAEKPHEALALIEELLRQNPKYGLKSNPEAGMKALSSILEIILRRYIGERDFNSAQTLMRRVERDYGEGRVSSVEQYRQRMVEMAEGHRDAGLGFMRNQQWREAYVETKKMLQVWPIVDGADELVRDVARRYSRVVVGVQQLATHQDPASLDNWAARRSGRLVHRMLVELERAGPTGGEYLSPYGAANSYDDLRGMTVQLRKGIDIPGYGPLTGARLARRLRDLATPQHRSYLSYWAGVMSEIRVDDGFRLQIDFHQPHVLPESMLQILLQRTEPGQPSQPSGPYRVASSSPTETTFVPNDNYALAAGTRPSEIVERLFVDRELAIEALRRGDIDVLDRLSPPDAIRLRNVDSVVVRQYELPTLQVLIPNYSNPFLARAAFRAALTFAIPREQILNQLILQGVSVPGARVISGPFPIGITPDDPLAYAYDRKIAPRPFDPRLAKTLAMFTEQELSDIANRREEAVPKLEPLVLGHPPGQLTQVVCEAIAAQLEKLEIACTLKELAPGTTVDPTGECDLIYTEVALWEPILDARRILGIGDLGQDISQHLDQGLRRLETSHTWRQVHLNLLDLHRLAFTQVPIIPLWQNVNFFAHRKGINNVGTSPLNLYQNVEKWEVVPSTE